MPQLIAAFAIGAGLYAGLSWLSRTLQREARRQAEERLKREDRHGYRIPKDLGTLEYDPDTQVYRPRQPGGR